MAKRKAKKVYVVTSGEYSDYTIKGIFSTREKAQSFIDNDKRECYFSYYNDIEEWGLDQLVHAKMHTVYTCNMILSTGEVDRTWHSEEYIEYLERPVEVNERAGRIWAKSTKSAEHAHKLAVEARQNYLRVKAVTA